KKRRCFQFAQYLVAVIVGLAVLASAVVSKGSLLMLAALSSPKSFREPGERQFYMLMLVFCLVFPNFLVFLKSLWRCLFKTFESPNMKTMAFICLIECVVSLGTSVMVLVVMPQFDVLTNLFISGGVCIFSAVLQIVFRLQRESWKILFPICSLLLTTSGYCLLVMDYYVRIKSFVDRQKDDSYLYVGIGILSSILISFCWWENAVQAKNRIFSFFFGILILSLCSIRCFICMWYDLLTGAVYLIYHVLIAKTIDWPKFNLAGKDQKTLQIGLILLFLQAFCSAACHWFGVVACKIHAVRMSFALPLCATGPAVLLLGLILLLTQGQNFVDIKYKNITGKSTIFLELRVLISDNICSTSLNSHYLQWPTAMLFLEGVCMWAGLVSCTYYVWKIQRIERTSQLFVRRLYESAFIDLSMLLNTKIKLPKAQTNENVVIYLCATMWHETYDEMLKILTSMFRLDRYRGDPKEDHKDSFDFECHIFVDDAFMTEKETGKRLVNEYVNDLTHVVTEVYRVFTNKEPDDVSIIDTPYGGRLMFVLPEGNMLYVHLKDKSLIRNKKRWSQIMYMYYLLGWKGYITKNPQKMPRMDAARESLISMDGEIFLLPQYDNDNKRRFISDDNTYILALDGDTDFHPKAVVLLVDRLRMYYNVGAACGRIHPTGMGPMVWYQKFEYAVGHWLQKTAEHVFGSVLCSPGCFSLFRGSALMDDHILKKYTTTSTRGAEYVQYDQGEDRWLCTLLLQQGWRVEYNAASDAYTNSPQEFKEFYNQRRRWGPSTLANTLDLLHSGSETVKKNQSISRLYIFYQMFTVGSSILGPASVTLMVAGAFQFIFKIDGAISIIISCIPPTLYIIICFTTKANTQITIAALMSVLYAFLMTASLFSIIGDMVVQKTFLTPTGVFLISMTIMYLITAILHPEEFGLIIYGLMYFICIPSGYLLLTIYGLVNMNNVSWGTRESKEEGEEKKHHSVVCNKDCRLCCWDWKIQVTQEAENVMLQQIAGFTGQKAPLLQITNNETQPQAPSNLQPQTKPDNITEKDGDVINPHTDKNRKASIKNKDLLTSHRYSSAFITIIAFQKSYSSDSSNSSHSSDEVDGDLEEMEDIPVRDWVEPVKEEFMKKLTYFNMKRNLEAQLRCTLNNKSHEDLCEELVLMLTDTINIKLSKAGPEDILDQAELDDLQHELTNQARRILKNDRMTKLEKRVKRAIEKTLSAPQVQRLDEKDFWDKLIERYLTPINDTPEHKARVSKELKSLRNKAVFLYFIINVLWVVATFFLQLIGNDIISIKIPKHIPGQNTTEYLKVEPLSLMFLFSFAILLLVQFVAMLYHRYTNQFVYMEEEEEEDATIENQYANSLYSEDFQL
uniref:chitin synthase n=1 Tax=Cyprinodon variegatus TaxID=28743 RepID=A0A3Q2D9Q7_CYPVA